ncbi:MAG TPA: histidine kinase [Candidatus Baltobacteraceae bacterium]|nr:histidine kinase [Candidatus Baltobacteraceae bacterium]
MVEDDDADAQIVQHTLQRGNVYYTAQRVDNKPNFIRELEKGQPNLILSDFSLPSFDGYSALAIAKERYPDVPFIFVTGTLGEEVAIETLKKGATDYVLKQRLTRLVPSVHRALREAQERAERRKAEEQLRQSHKQLRSLSVYLQHVREEERIKIAREIHDELGQQLTGLKLQLTWLDNRLPKKSRMLHEKAKTMASGIDETIQAVRRIATELRPGVLDSAGLVAAIEWQASEFQKKTGIQCRVHSSVRETIWNQELNTTFFRIFQETLTNIIRHANATKVDVRFMETANQFVLEIRDNGRGISSEEINNTKSIGLLGMRERATLLGGEVRLRGEPKRGTTVSVRIPRPGQKLRPSRD